jgi:DnaJ-class molecular chaperone
MTTPNQPHEDQPSPCPVCGGSGMVDMGYCDEHKGYERVVAMEFDGPVLVCQTRASAKYTISQQPCSNCSGSGEVVTSAA